MPQPQHFLSLHDLGAEPLRALLERAAELKAMHARGEGYRPLQSRIAALLFEKSSTRTRISFEAAMVHLGGQAMFLAPKDIQLGRGESIEDSARVMSRMVDAIVIRTFEHERLERFAAHSRVPVINALTDRLHPCQLLADMLTWVEHAGDPAGKTAAWIGDGNNVCHSWINAAALLGFRLNVASPAGYEPDAGLCAAAGDAVQVMADPVAAVRDAEVVVTDVWASMGQEQEQGQRAAAFAGYQVDEALMRRAGANAIFMHCLPAHRGEEVSAAVIDGQQSRVWDEAENRLHAQKALLELLLARG